MTKVERPISMTLAINVALELLQVLVESQEKKVDYEIAISYLNSVDDILPSDVYDLLTELTYSLESL